ncbi:hypothetical protein BLA9940_02096 [Burkholderia aenigmatica]|uniref:hypothetical protein n=1 Tax=Burkholderia aenigmatica TaxID=2015348 RepID=UPI0014544F88|nr:hypothetical protein [Burkholderia aenigmatica]VWC53770.1 hypothetical protein BLA9940_02096 [Burkholderia aenigmatica]
MKIAGLGQSAKRTAEQLYALWIHLGEDECREQIEAHMESEGFSQDAIDIEIERLEVAGNF